MIVISAILQFCRYNSSHPNLICAAPAVILDLLQGTIYARYEAIMATGMTFSPNGLVNTHTHTSTRESERDTAEVVFSQPRVVGRISIGGVVLATRKLGWGWSYVCNDLFLIFPGSR